MSASTNPPKTIHSPEKDASTNLVRAENPGASKDAKVPLGFQIVKVRKPDGTIVKVKRPVPTAAPAVVKDALAKDVTAKKTEIIATAAVKPTRAAVNSSATASSGKPAVVPTDMGKSSPTVAAGPASTPITQSPVTVKPEKREVPAPATTPTVAVARTTVKPTAAPTKTNKTTNIANTVADKSAAPVVPAAGTAKPTPVPTQPVPATTKTSPAVTATTPASAKRASPSVPPRASPKAPGPAGNSPATAPAIATTGSKAPAKAKKYEELGKEITHMDVGKVAAVLDSTASSVENIGKAINRIDKVLTWGSVALQNTKPAPAKVAATAPGTVQAPKRPGIPATASDAGVPATKATVASNTGKKPAAKAGSMGTNPKFPALAHTDTTQATPANRAHHEAQTTRQAAVAVAPPVHAAAHQVVVHPAAGGHAPAHLNYNRVKDGTHDWPGLEEIVTGGEEAYGEYVEGDEIIDEADYPETGVDITGRASQDAMPKDSESGQFRDIINNGNDYDDGIEEYDPERDEIVGDDEEVADYDSEKDEIVSDDEEVADYDPEKDVIIAEDGSEDPGENGPTPENTSTKAYHDGGRVEDEEGTHPTIADDGNGSGNENVTPSEAEAEPQLEYEHSGNIHRNVQYGVAPKNNGGSDDNKDDDGDGIEDDDDTKNDGDSDSGDVGGDASDVGDGEAGGHDSEGTDDVDQDDD